MKRQKNNQSSKLFLNKERITILNKYQTSKILGGDTNDTKTTTTLSALSPWISKK